MVNEELKEVTQEVRKLLLRWKNFEEIRIILKEKNYSDELISGAFVQTQVKSAKRRLAHRRKTINIVNKSSNVNLLILLGLIIYATIHKGDAASSILTSITVMSKLFSLSMIINSISQLELRWTVALSIVFFVPGLDIIGAGWYYLIVKLKNASTKKS